MQTVSRYLLSQLVIAYVNGYHGRNSKVYDRRLTLHRGVSNPITFTFKNEDQKAQDIVGKTYELNVIDTETQKSVITKTLTVLDDGSTVSTKGDASTTITEGDLLPLDAKFYNFAVKEVKSDGTREVTYADTGYAAAGSIEILDGAYAQFTASVSVSQFSKTGTVYASGAIDARPGINNNKALHTIAVYPQAFSGTLTVEGTMASTPADTDYFTITTSTFSSASSVTTLNFTGVFQSVRFKWENTTGNTGKIDKILYRQ